MKYNEGDKIEIELTEVDARSFNINNYTMVRKDRITKHTPAPFDWSQVKPGMAFKFPDELPNDNRWAWHFVGKLPNHRERLFFVCENGQSANFSSDGSGLIRAPEHDIEVSKP